MILSNNISVTLLIDLMVFLCFLGSSFYFINNLSSEVMFLTMGSALLWGQGQGTGQNLSLCSGWS